MVQQADRLSPILSLIGQALEELESKRQGNGSVASTKSQEVELAALRSCQEILKLTKAVCDYIAELGKIIDRCDKLLVETKDETGHN